jgi:8-oxo-dGTP pyrophosphatase MutT (NUDIX family)
MINTINTNIILSKTHSHNRNKNIQCLNCGFYGHTIKSCNHPITSYGIICYKKFNNEIKYLMIQRKDSLCYIEFIRGKYKLCDIKYLCRLFKFITNTEKNKIFHNNFETLWKDLWKDYDINKFKKEFLQSKRKFDKIKSGFKNENTNINFSYLFEMSQNTNDLYNQTEWEFPKGRRNLNEHNIKCAIREFEEESGLKKNKIKLINNKSYEEIYIAVNKTRYRHIYYLAKCNYNDINLFDPNNKTQIKEVKDVKWLNYNNVINNIRNIYIERIELFKRINKIITKHENSLELFNNNYNCIYLNN